MDIDDGLNGRTPAQRLADALALLSSNNRVIIRNNSNAPVRLTKQIVRTAAWGAEKQVFAYGTQRIKLDLAGAPGQRVLLFWSAAREHWKGFEVVNCTTRSDGFIVVTNSTSIKLEDWWIHNNPGPTSQIAIFGGTDNVVQDSAMWHNGDGSTNSTNTGDGIGLSLGMISPTRIHIVRCYIANANDDGVDMWAGTGSEVVDCAIVGAGQYWNGHPAGDGIGVKMGGLSSVAGGNSARGSIVLSNRVAGINANFAKGTSHVEHITAFGNGASGNIHMTTSSQGQVEEVISVQSGLTHGNVNGGQDALASTIVDIDNCWDPPFQVSKTQRCQDPQFADPASGDFSLLPGSPYVDPDQDVETLGASTIALQLLKDHWTHR